MTPDRVIVRKVKSYDPELSIRWNAQKCWFELWRKPFMRAPQLITPVTESIYDASRPLRFTPLDERLLWWIYEADTYRHGGPKRKVMEEDERWKEFIRKSDQARRQHFRDMAKDVYTLANYQFVNKGQKKEDRYPKFNNYEKQTNWVRPDSTNVTSSRLMTRSRSNALRYNFKPR